MTLVPRRLLRPFEDICAWHGTIGRIVEAFVDEGVVIPRGDYASRRETFACGIDAIPSDATGGQSTLLRVLETVLSWCPTGDDTRAMAIAALGRDGWTVNEHGRILGSGRSTATSNDLPLEEIRDPAAISEHLRRIGKASDDDPALAISAAKALVEATAKLVLEELGRDYDARADIPALVREVQKALSLHPEDVAPTTRGQKTIQLALSNLSQVAVRVAELRNEYGSDHGRAVAYVLQPRHAHLAVGCAEAFCRMLLETLAERRAH